MSDGDRHDFVSWLQNADSGQIHWINGKAGSGKSTLMRYITEHERTRADLQKWAQMPLIVASFYFWTGGSAIQRSQSGLLRSLLHQLLKRRRDLIPWAFPELWLACQDTKKRVGMLVTWEYEKLWRGFRTVLRLASKDSYICLFIDGLEEFDGNEETVVDLVSGIVGMSHNIKTCVSSRAWPAFEEAFCHVPKLLLQDLTGADMK